MTIPHPGHILLRSSWQSVNIGDIAHTPGMLALLEQHLPEVRVTLWPGHLLPAVEAALRTRFPHLEVADTAGAQETALAACDLVLHGSGPGLVGLDALRRARALGKPYAIGGITLSDAEITAEKGLLAGACMVALRDTDSLRALQAADSAAGNADFGPDATFALDLMDPAAADALLAGLGLEAGGFLCAVPRLRWTPYWEIHPEQVRPNPERIAENARHVEADHAKLREAIIAWVRTTGRRVLLCPEMTYAVPLLRPLLFDPLPADVKGQVAVLDRYWLTAEAHAVYARAAAVVSCEQHSPIMAIASGVPAVLVRQPTDTRKGRMWRDIGLDPWIFEIDSSSGGMIAAAVAAIGRDPSAARAAAAAGRDRAHAAMAAMVGRIAAHLPGRQALAG